MRWHDLVTEKVLVILIDSARWPSMVTVPLYGCLAAKWIFIVDLPNLFRKKMERVEACA